jgi:hypothetical protein
MTKRTSISTQILRSSPQLGTTRIEELWQGVQRNMWFGRPYILCWSGDKLWELHDLSDELSLRNYLAGGKGTPKQREARENAHNREQQEQQQYSQRTAKEQQERKRPQQRTASKESTTRETRSNESAAIGLRPQVYLIV